MQYEMKAEERRLPRMDGGRMAYVRRETTLCLQLYCFWFLLLLLQFLGTTTTAFSSYSSTTAFSSYSSSPASSLYCGGIQIPYPFGVLNSALQATREDFRVRCDINDPKPMLPVGGKRDLQILNISLEEGFVSVAMDAIAQHCEGDPSNETMTHSSSWINLKGTAFTFSDTRNRFTVIGCDALSMIQPSGSSSYTTGCVAFCGAEGALDGSCSGIGCCQAPIPPGLQSFSLKFRTIGDASGSNCSKAFLMQNDQFTFSIDDLDVKKLPLVLEWVIGNQSCEEASLSRETYACMNNTQCYNSSAGVGYRCKCKNGYSGNPYYPLGCEDIDECTDADMNGCVDSAECVNEPGSFQCKCPKGMNGDGRKGRSGCTKTSEGLPKAALGAAVGIFCLLVMVGTFWSYWLLQRRRATKLKVTFFRQNGGLLLQKQVASLKGGNQGAKIFTAEEILKATDRFSETRILGRGGQGTVYKGILPDKRAVAIKKSRISDETQIEQFINEVVILSQINHKNVVKLLGCCLETQVPLLVYEFVPNGTLSDHIHGKKQPALPLTWEHRLRIAAETAGALAYLHSAASVPIIHRDVKSTNILLGKSFTAKVSDFGASRSVPFDRTHITTLVQGTFGYLDPEYFQTSQLTEKSDVYSFGVVLVELLTREKPVSYDRPEEERNLASYFITSLKKKRLRRVLDAEIVHEAGIEHLGVIVRLAERCLSLRGEERPTMKEVAMELQWARRFLEKEQVRT